jgi:hypothetical protein
MTDKSALRLARERAGLSRAQLAEKLETTVHHYWQSEMGTSSENPELTARAWRLLGGTAPEGGTSPQGQSTPADSGQSGGQIVWVCRLCGHEETQPSSVQAMSHICPKRNKTGTGHREDLVMKIGD